MPTEVERLARRRHFLFPENKARTMSKLTIKTLILLRIGNNLQYIHSSLRLESALLPLINHDLLQNLPEIQLHPHPPLIAEIVKTKASWKLPSSSFAKIEVCGYGSGNRFCGYPQFLLIENTIRVICRDLMDMLFVTQEGYG